MRDWLITGAVDTWGFPVCVAAKKGEPKTPCVDMGEVSAAAETLLCNGVQPAKGGARAFFVSWARAEEQSLSKPVVWTEAASGRSAIKPGSGICNFREPDAVFTTAALFRQSFRRSGITARTCRSSRLVDGAAQSSMSNTPCRTRRISCIAAHWTPKALRGLPLDEQQAMGK